MCPDLTRSAYMVPGVASKVISDPSRWTARVATITASRSALYQNKTIIVEASTLWFGPVTSNREQDSTKTFSPDVLSLPSHLKQPLVFLWKEGNSRENHVTADNNYIAVSSTESYHQTDCGASLRPRGRRLADMTGVGTGEENTKNKIKRTALKIGRAG